MAELRAELVELLPRLRRFARVLARDAHDADDLVQTAIERALAHAGQLRADAPLAGWMFGILRNAWIDEQRARGRRGRVFAAAESGEQVADPAHGAPLERLAVQDAVARLRNALGEVSGVLLGDAVERGADALAHVPTRSVAPRSRRSAIVER